MTIGLYIRFNSLTFANLFSCGCLYRLLAYFIPYPFWFNETCHLHNDLRLFSTLSFIWWHMYYHSQHFSMPVLFSGWQTKYIVSIISSGFFFKLYRFWLIAYFIQSVFHDPYRLLDGLLFVGLNDSPFLFIVGCDTVIKRPYLKGKP